MTEEGKGDMNQLHGLHRRGLLPGGITGGAPGPSLIGRGRHKRLAKIEGSSFLHLQTQ